MAKYATAEAAIHCVDQAIQTHGGNGLTTEYGVGMLAGVVRLMRIAPVSREMILNYVAQHSWACPSPTDPAPRRITPPVAIPGVVIWLLSVFIRGGSRRKYRRGRKERSCVGFSRFWS